MKKSMTMRYRFALIFLLFAALSGAAAAPTGKKAKVQLPANLPAKFSDQEIGWIKTKLSPEFYSERVQLIASEFYAGRNRVPIPPPIAQVYIQELKKYSQYYFFESDTGLDVRYAGNCIKYAEALHKAKITMQGLIMNRKTGTEEYRKWYDYYNKTAKEFVALAARPVKSVNRKRIAYLEKIKQMVLKQITDAEQAKKDAAVKLDDRKSSRRK